MPASRKNTDPLDIANWPEKDGQSEDDDGNLKENNIKADIDRYFTKRG